MWQREVILLLCQDIFIRIKATLRFFRSLCMEKINRTIYIASHISLSIFFCPLSFFHLLISDYFKFIFSSRNHVLCDLLRLLLLPKTHFNTLYITESGPAFHNYFNISIFEIFLLLKLFTYFSTLKYDTYEMMEKSKTIWVYDLYIRVSIGGL